MASKIKEIRRIEETREEKVVAELWTLSERASVEHGAGNLQRRNMLAICAGANSIGFVQPHKFLEAD